MKEILETIKKHNLNVYSVTEVSNGHIETVRVREDSACRNAYSVSKAYTMAAVGFLFDEKKLKLTDSIKDIFGYLPEGSDEKWYDVTVHNILRHETGLLQGQDLDNENLREFTSGDWLDYLFSKPIEGIPGKTVAYTDLNYYLLSGIVTELTGISLYEYMRVKLFNPMTFRETAWSACPSGRSLGGTGLYVSSEDMAKLGQLWLADGMWNGKQLISPEWIDLSLSESYAFGAINREKGRYYKTGMKGQIIYFSYSDNYVLSIQSYLTTGSLGVITAPFYNQKM